MIRERISLSGLAFVMLFVLMSNVEARYDSTE